jgi:hypothetical protein
MARIRLGYAGFGGGLDGVDWMAVYCAFEMCAGEIEMGSGGRVY